MCRHLGIVLLRLGNFALFSKIACISFTAAKLYFTRLAIVSPLNLGLGFDGAIVAHDYASSKSVEPWLHVYCRPVNG